MKKDKLIVTDAMWYKICNFFRKVFNINKKYNDMVSVNSYKTCGVTRKYDKDNQIEEIKRRNVLAEKLMQGEIDINTLSDLEVIEMTEYFSKYVNEMNQKLEYIKRNIMKLRKKSIEE